MWLRERDFLISHWRKHIPQHTHNYENVTDLCRSNEAKHQIKLILYNWQFTLFSFIMAKMMMRLWQCSSTRVHRHWSRFTNFYRIRMKSFFFIQNKESYLRNGKKTSWLNVERWVREAFDWTYFFSSWFWTENQMKNALLSVVNRNGNGSGGFYAQKFVIFRFVSSPHYTCIS